MTYFRQLLVLALFCVVSTPVFAETWEKVSSTNSAYSAYLDVDSIVQSNNYYFYNVKYYNEKAKGYLIATIQSRGNQAGIVNTCKLSDYEKNKNLLKIDINRKAKELKILDTDSPIYNINEAAKNYYNEHYSMTTTYNSGSNLGSRNGSDSSGMISRYGSGSGSRYGSGNGSGAGSGNGYKKSTGGGGGHPGNGGHSGLDTAKEPDFGPYMKDLQRRIKRNWDPPKESESKRVVLLFRIAKDGRLLSCSVYESSGLQYVDAAAINAVKSASPFSPLPTEYKEQNIDIQFTFDYNVFGEENR